MARFVAVCSVVLLLCLAAPAGAQTAHSATDETVTNPDDGTTIGITIFRPATASPESQVPVVLHSHGWGGSRTTTIGGTVQSLLDAGFGVVSIDQRGHGESSGEAHVQDPTRETEDIKAVIDRVAELDWVLHDTDSSGNPVANDPVLGAIGGSYGGGYQTMTALDEIADEGATRFDALAPEITWYDLPESLAPQKVVRSVWNVALYAVGAANVPQFIHEAFAWGTATGQWPDGTLYGQEVDGAPDLDSVFHEHSPVAFAERGIRIDIPVLLRQGTSDNLFNLNQGLHIFDEALTDGAREQSYLVGYNGGHALPNVLPPGTAAGDDACSPGGFTELTIEFFRRVFAGETTDGLLPASYNLTTAGGDKCLHLDEFGASSLDVDPLGTGNVVSTTGLGAPLHLPVAEGPLTVAGIPRLAGAVTALGLDSRAFFGLSVGTSPADALVIQNNLMPLREPLPVTDAPFDIELPGVAVEVPEGQSLFLTISPASDMYIEHGTKPAGALVLSGLSLTLPGPVGSAL
ncbi:MAG: alpha/beta hydrolase family protein [Actinomycetota bacterium]